VDREPPEPCQRRPSSLVRPSSALPPGGDCRGEAVHRPPIADLTVAIDPDGDDHRRHLPRRCRNTGRREVLGLSIGPSEAEHFWTEFLRPAGAPRSVQRQAGDLGRA
jgi:hypothetical protein